MKKSNDIRNFKNNIDVDDNNDIVNVSDMVQSKRSGWP